MKLVSSFILALVLASPAFAVRTYQVTGPVLEFSGTKVIVQKGKEKWEIDQTPTTKINGELKVGSKVTIEYTMVAESVTLKADKPEAKKK